MVSEHFVRLFNHFVRKKPSWKCFSSTRSSITKRIYWNMYMIVREYECKKSHTASTEAEIVQPNECAELIVRSFDY